MNSQNSSGIQLFIRLEFWRVATEEWARWGKLVADCSWAAIAEDPAAVIASDETLSTTLHFANGRACANEAAGVAAGFDFGFGVWEGRDRCDEREDTEEDGTHDDEMWVEV